MEKTKEQAKNYEEWAPIPCELTYGRPTKSGSVLPTTVEATLNMDVETLEFVFCDEKNFELLRVGPEDVEVLEITRVGLFAPKTEILAVTQMEDDGSTLTFQARKIANRYRAMLTNMVDYFVEGLYFRRGNIWIRDEVAFEEYQNEIDE